ncbi:HTH-type transcriptional regulator ImmR [compost metagenome]
MKSTGKMIRELRLKRNLSQEELAEGLNLRFGSSVNKGMVSKWENDISEPRLDAVRQLSEFFHVSLDYLIGSLEQSPPPNQQQPDISEDQILTIAAHQVGHEGPLTAEQMDKIKLAMRIALAKEEK